MTKSDNGQMTTMILCGGRGSRLRPLTDRVPKTLVKLDGRPILYHLLQSYIDKGYQDFVICVGYRGDMVEEFVDSSALRASVRFSDAGDEASMLSRLYQAREMMTDRVFVAYGDTLIDVDLDDMLSKHESTGAAITITTANVRSPFGLVSPDPEGLVESFEEKPLQWYYVGHMLMEKSVLYDIAPDLIDLPEGDGIVALFNRLISENRLRMYPYGGPQITFNTHRELNQAERDFVSFFTHEEARS